MRKLFWRILAGESKSVWPKPEMYLTSEEEFLKKQIALECQHCGYEGLTGWLQAQGHFSVERLSNTDSGGSDPCLSLEVGCGSGYHFGLVEQGKYFGLDYDFAQLSRARYNHPEFPLIQADAYNLPFKTGMFDRVVSVYVLEHLHRLPTSLKEIQRVLKLWGELHIGLPAEGGLVYEIGRRLTTKRQIERKYNVDYLKIIRSEHCNTFPEVFSELGKMFKVKEVYYLPLGIPILHLNAVVVMQCVNVPRPNRAAGDD